MTDEAVEGCGWEPKVGLPLLLERPLGPESKLSKSNPLKITNLNVYQKLSLENSRILFGTQRYFFGLNSWLSIFFIQNKLLFASNRFGFFSFGPKKVSHQVCFCRKICFVSRRMNSFSIPVLILLPADTDFGGSSKPPNKLSVSSSLFMLSLLEMFNPK